MSLSKLANAASAEERSEALDRWEGEHGGAFELMAVGQLPEVLRPELTATVSRELLVAYAAARRRFLEAIELDDPSIFDVDAPESRFHMALYSIVQHLEGDLEEARPIIEELLESGDAEMMRVASGLMEKMSAAGFSFETARRTMARHGINEIPYKLGNAVANWVRADPARVAEIEAALVEGEDLEKQALCAVLQDLGEAAAPLLDRLLEVARSDELDPESRSCAISTLGALGVVNSLVSEAIEQALRSPHWFIRGNAAGVAGSLVLDPPHFIPLVMCLLEDDEGHDWSPSEKAVEALGKYGPAAVDAIGAIEALRAATESDDTWLLDEIERALALIRGDEPPPREDD